MLVNRLDELLAAFARQCRNFKDRAFEFEAFNEILDERLTLVGIDHVELVEDQPAWLFIQRFIVFLELADDSLGLRDRIDIFIERGHINDMQQQAGALQVAQKQMSQARAFRRPFNQTGQVGDHKALLGSDPYHAQVRMQGSERIVGNAWPCIGNRRDECRFTGIGHAQQADIGQHFQLKLQAFPVTGPAGCFAARGAVG